MSNKMVNARVGVFCAAKQLHVACEVGVAFAAGSLRLGNPT